MQVNFFYKFSKNILTNTFSIWSHSRILLLKGFSGNEYLYQWVTCTTTNDAECIRGDTGPQHQVEGHG